MKELSELLAGRGHEVTVLTSNVRRTYHLCLKIDGGLPSCEIINGARILRYDPGGGLIGRILSRWYRVKGGYRSLKALLGETNL